MQVWTHCLEVLLPVPLEQTRLGLTTLTTAALNSSLRVSEGRR